MILTEQQTNAIDYQGNMVIIAVPGSGKTTVLSNKIGYELNGLKQHQGVVAISFTNKASEELKKRSKNKNLNVKSSFFGTIDSFCASEIVMPFLKHFWRTITSELSVIILKDEASKGNDVPKSLIQSSGTEIAAEDVEKYEDELKQLFFRGIIPLEFLGALTLYVLQCSKSCREYLKARYRSVYIDEYQDSGKTQHAIFLELVKLGLTGIAVGDANQSIFGFSGKDSRYLTSLAHDGRFKLFPIDRNHRCHPSIINYSLKFLNSTASLIPATEIRVSKKTVQGDERRIAQWIDAHLEKVKERFSVSRNSDIGILTRTGRTGQLVHEALKTQSFLNVGTTLDSLFSLWASVFNSLLHYRYSDKVTAEEVLEMSNCRLNAKDKRELRKRIKELKILDLKTFEECVISIAQTLLPNAEHKETVLEFKKLLSQKGHDIFFKPPDENSIQIMTLHKAKGLEFDVVFHLDLCEWVFPSKFPGPGNDFDNLICDLDQEKNLHFVGITRARKALCLVTSTQRTNSYGQTKKGNPSEFLCDPQLYPFRNDV